MAEKLLRTHFPYCLQRLADGSYAVLNRNYKPLGVMSGEWVKYEDAPGNVKFKGMTAAMAQQLSWEGSPALDRIFLYNDGTNPGNGPRELAAYLERLGRLLAQKVE